jgi:hypothetical protein
VRAALFSRAHGRCVGTKEAARLRAARARRRLLYFVRYTRSPASFLLDSTASPIFLLRVPEMKPRMLCFCQPVALAISAIDAPALRRIRSSTMAFLENSRGTLAVLVALLRVVFFAAGFPALAVPGFRAPLSPFGAPLLVLATLVAVAGAGASWAPRVAAVGFVVVLVVSFGIVVVPLCALAHDDSSLTPSRTSSVNAHRGADLLEGKAMPQAFNSVVQTN